MPKRVTSLRSLLRVIAPGQQSFYRRNLQRWYAIGNTASNLAGPRFEPQTSRFGDERVNRSFDLILFPESSNERVVQYFTTIGYSHDKFSV